MINNRMTEFAHMQESINYKNVESPSTYYQGMFCFKKVTVQISVCKIKFLRAVDVGNITCELPPSSSPWLPSQQKETSYIDCR